MRKRMKLAVGAGAALAVAGGGAAIAATGTSPQAESQAVVNDAAEQLGVDPAKLSDALEQALANRVDAAIKDGRLTEAQGAELKAQIQAGTFPLFGGRGDGPVHHGRGFGGHHLDAAATYLGVTEAALRASLESGKTLAQVAEDESKSVDALVAALVADETKELDAAVTAGNLTKAMRDELVSGLEQRITAHVNGERPAHKPGFGGRHGFGGPAFDTDNPPAPRAA